MDRYVTLVVRIHNEDPVVKYYKVAPVFSGIRNVVWNSPGADSATGVET